MLARQYFTLPDRRLEWPALQSHPRFAEKIAAAATIGLIMASAAMPDDRDLASAISSSSPVSTTLAPGKETNVGAYLGAPYHYPSDFHLTKTNVTDVTIKDVHWFTLPFENPLYYGARIQRWFDGGRFGAMIDFTHSKVHAPLDADAPFEGKIDGKPVPATAKIGDYFDKLEWTHGHNMLTLNGLVRLPSLGLISPYAGLGAGITLPHSEIHLKSDASRTYEYQYAGPTAQGLFGLEFRLKAGSIFVEYKFTFADYWGPLTGRAGEILPIDLWRQFSRWWKGEDPPDGWAGARLASHQLIGGFMVRFVPGPAGTAPR